MNKTDQKFCIRHYTAGDREAVRAICCNTGFLGKPIDPLFEDRELFADYLTSYYTDAEPESSFVVEKGGVVLGYLLGCRHPERQQRHEWLMLPGLVMKGIWRYFTRPYNAATKKYVRWILTTARKEVPPAPKGIAHFHINLLEEVRSVGETRELIDSFLEYLARCGEKQVYGQVVVFDGRRGELMFRRYGFELLNKAEITKYRDIHPEPVFLYTVVKDLTKNVRLYGSKEREP